MGPYFLKDRNHLHNVCSVDCITDNMMDASPYRVSSAELFRDGVIITFADGKCALFPAELLYASLPQAQELSENEEEESSD